jgi:hypothetical protein
MLKKNQFFNYLEPQWIHFLGLVEGLKGVGRGPCQLRSTKALTNIFLSQYHYISQL